MEATIMGIVCYQFTLYLVVMFGVGIKFFKNDIDIKIIKHISILIMIIAILELISSLKVLKGVEYD